MPIRTILVAVVALLLAAPAADAAVTYRDAEMGVSVRLAKSGRSATLTFENGCAPASARTSVRVKRRRGPGEPRGRFVKRIRVTCGTPPGGTDTIRLVGRVYRSRVNGEVDGEPFIAERGGRRPTAAERCAGRGMPLAETEQVRVSTYGLDTIACLLAGGRQSVIGTRDPDSDETNAAGVDVKHVTILGTRVAYLADAYDSAADRYGQGDSPALAPTIVVEDLAGGTPVRAPTSSTVEKLVLHPDGRVAWSGPVTGPADVHVSTIQDGQAVQLDRGVIDPEVAAGGGAGFVWVKTG